MEETGDPVGPERRGFACPAQAREALDRLEAQVEADGPDLESTDLDLQGDWVPEVPGAGEPPD